FRAGQGAADRLPQGRRAHLSVERGVRPGAQDRRDRLRHHVEGARRAVAERRHQGRDRGAQGRRADVRLGLRDAEERAQQGSGLRLAQRHDGAVGAEELRHRHGLQPDSHRRRRAGGRGEAHRLHRRGEEAPGRPRLRLHGQDRRRQPGLVEQVVQGLMHQELMRKNQNLTAAALLGPATIFIAVGLLAPLAILFRYSLNSFVAQTKTMVEALTIQNYVTFFTDPYYTGALGTTVRVALLVTVVCLVLGFPLAYVVARTQSRYK